MSNIQITQTQSPKTVVIVDRGIAGVGVESAAIVFVDPLYFLEFTYTNGTIELVELPAIASGVVSFNTRIGVVTLTNTDVTDALTYIPVQPNGTGATGTWTISINGNASTVTNGVYTTDTGTVTNTMLAGSIANNKLANSAITVNGASTALGGSVNVGTVTNVSATAGTGIAITGSPISTTGTLNITNTAPDQVVGLTGSGTTTITGTYPNFTVTTNDQYVGTVTSVATTVPSFLNVSGSPITTNGTLAIGYSGTALPVANGGTGATTSASALTTLGAYPATNPSGYTTNTGTVTSVSGTGTVNGISLSGTVTSNGNITLGGALTGVNLTSQVTGTLPVGNGGTGITSLGAGVATFLSAPTSANLASAVTNETGTGALVFGTSPTLTTPSITGGTINPTTLQENSIPVVVQSDIGTAPNEIPLNQYLGSMAYQSLDNVIIGNLTVSAGVQNSLTNTSIKTGNGLLTNNFAAPEIMFSASGQGIYIVFAYLEAYDPNDWSAQATVTSSGGTSLKLTTVNGAGMQITVSGTDVLCQQIGGGGSALGTKYVYQKII